MDIGWFWTGFIVGAVTTFVFIVSVLAICIATDSNDWNKK